MVFRNNNYGLPAAVVNRKKFIQHRDNSSNKTKDLYEVNFKTHPHDQRSLSPNKLNATKKPFANFVSPRNNNVHRHHENGRIDQQNLGRLLNIGTCTKHRDKYAEFLANVEGQTLPFCERCAIQLASQGAEILKVYDNKKQNQKRQSFKHMKYQGRPEYEEVKGFIHNLNVVQQKHINQLNRIKSIEKHYKSQISLTENFYSELLDMISQMREDHINDIIKEGEKHIQIGEIEKGYLQQNIQEMNLFRSDIEGQIDLIIEDYKDNQGKFQQIMNFYRNKVGMFQMKNEETQEFLHNFIDYKASDLSNQIKRIEEFIIEGWQFKIQKYQKSSNKKKPENQTSKKIINFINLDEGKMTENTDKNFCRKLFEEDCNRPENEISPQFKNI